LPEGVIFVCTIMPRAPTVSGRTTDVVTEETTKVTFDDFLLKPQLVQALSEFEYYHPSPVQLKVIPAAFEGVDLLVQAKSGTGKTLAFGLVLLQMLKPEENAMVLCPTREIALQTEDEISRAGWHLEPKVVVRSFVGGTPEASDGEKCTDCQIIVGTPGRVLKLLTKKCISTPVRFLVLDEADKLLEEGFRSVVSEIVTQVVGDATQLIAASATFPPHLVALAEKIMNPTQKINGMPQLPTRPLPQRIFLCSSVVKRRNSNTPIEDGSSSNPAKDDENSHSVVLQGVKQIKFELHGCHVKQKVEPLWEVFSTIPFNQCVVFLNNSTQAQQVAELINAKGIPAVATSSKQDQAWRRAVLIGVKRFHYRVVVASDLWSRGVDISKVDLVINLDLPPEKETYLHRVGRAGRFGKLALVVNLLFREEMKALEYFQAQLNLELTDWAERETLLKNIDWEAEEGKARQNNVDGQKITSEGEAKEEEEPCSETLMNSRVIPFDTFDMREQRIDPQDGCKYYLEDFLAQYGGSFATPPVEWNEAELINCYGDSMGFMNDRRIDPADGCLYTLDDFIAEYGGSTVDPPQQWCDAVGWTDQRIDPADNQPYTLQDFIAQYGGTFQEPPHEWSQAHPAPENKQSSASTYNMGSGKRKKKTKKPQRHQEGATGVESTNATGSAVGSSTKPGFVVKDPTPRGESSRNSPLRRVATPSNVSAQPHGAAGASFHHSTNHNNLAQVMVHGSGHYTRGGVIPPPLDECPLLSPSPQLQQQQQQQQQQQVQWSLRQLFPPPPLPQHLVPAGSGIPAYEPWMKGVDYATYSEKLRERSQLECLWTQHIGMWDK